MPLPDLKQYAAETLLTDPGLFDEVSGEDARFLLDWGTAQAEAFAEEAGDREALEDRLKALRHFLRRLNRLTARRATLDPEEYAKLAGRLTKYGAQAFGTDEKSALAALKSLRGEAHADRAFIERVLALFEPQDVQISEPESPPNATESTESDFVSSVQTGGPGCYQGYANMGEREDGEPEANE